MRIGTAGWTIPREFADSIKGEGTHLERYSRAFDCAEINSSFHRSHRVSTWQRWADSVPDKFVFSVKAPKQFTHVSALKVEKTELKQFLAEAGTLDTKLGPLLFQLPPKLAFDNATSRRLLTNLRELFDGPVVWEPRHPSWFSPEAESLLTTFHVSRVAADPAIVPDATLPGAFTDLVYFRLHGSPRKYYSSYSDDYLSKLAKTLGSCNAKNIWCIFDNTASGAALGNALKLQSRLESVFSQE
jgi:uncharacterized protein YecE (DUF72 family)